MRKTLIACLLALCSGAAAQTETSVYRPGVTPEGAVYFLPKTVLRFVVRVEKTSYTPGDFCRYAQRYLRLNDVKAEPSVTHRLIGLSMTTFGELGFSSAARPSSSVKGRTSVAICVFGSSKQRMIVSIWSGRIKGSSPWTLITTSYSAPNLR